MRKIPLILVLSIIVATNTTAQNAALNCGNGRYINNVFTAVSKTTGIVYGYNTSVDYITSTTFNNTLLLDFYEPAADPALKRPLIILAFGGSFISGQRSDMDALCLAFSKKGYATATIDYRLIQPGPSGNNYPFVYNNFTLLSDEIIKAAADMKAAIRFFKRDAATTNTYRIDPSKIFIGGFSAGAITALQTAYINNVNDYPIITPQLMANGGFEGNTDLPAPNNLLPTYNSNGIAGVLNLAGGVIDTLLINATDPPVYTAQGNNDELVPYTFGTAGGSTFSLYGGLSIHNRASNIGLASQLYTIAGGNHASPVYDPYFSVMMAGASAFFAAVVCSPVILPVDNQPPSIPSNITVFLDANGYKSLQPADVAPLITDNSAVNYNSITVSANSFNCSNVNVATPHQVYVSNSADGNQNFHGEVGMDFRVNVSSGIVIEQLGAFDHQANGLIGTQPDGNGGFGIRVAVFNKATQTIVPGLSAVIVGNGDAFAGNYRYKNIPPVTLAPGDYVVVTKGYNADELLGNSYVGGGPYPTGDNAGGAISYLNTAFYDDDVVAGFNYPANAVNTATSNVYKAGTFTYILNQNNAVTITAADVSGNQSQATTFVTVIDTFYVLTTKNITINLNSFNQATIQPVDVLLSLKKNCGVDVTTSTLQVSPSTFTCADISAGSGTPHQAYVSNQSNGNANYDGQFGLTFKVNSAGGVVIDKLGAFDDQSNGTGITGSEEGGVRVAIFNQNTQAIVPGLDVTIIGATDPLVGNYRMRSITPVTLPAGNYVIVTKGYVGEKFYNRQQTGPLNPVGDHAGGALSFLNTVYYGTSAPFNFPAGSTDAGSPNEYIAGTFNYKTLVAAGATVTLTATDVYGHQKQATAQVVVKEVTGPTVITQNITLNLNSSGTASITANDVLQNPVTDNCGVQSVTVSPNNFTCADYSSSGGGGTPHQAYVSDKSVGNANYDGQFGLTFKVNSVSGIVIDKLGAFDDLSNGTGITGNQSGGIRVAIFNQNTQAMVPGLDVIIVGATDPMVGNYRMRSITPVTLLPGNYVIVTKGYVGEKFYNHQQTGSLNPAGDNADGALSFLNTVYYGTSASFSFPASSGDAGNPNEYIAGTFNYSSGGGGGTPHQAYVSNQTAGNANYDGQFGLTFKVNSAGGVVIDKLGAFDDQSNGTGITGSEEGGVRVAIFNQNTQAIVPGLDVTIIGATDPLVGNYRMRSITPVTLPAGNYVIVTKGYVGEKFYNRQQTGSLNPTGDNADDALTFLNTVYYGSSASFSFPAGSGDAGNPNEYIAGTFNYMLSASNTKTVTITATDIHGNITNATAMVTLTNPYYSCIAPGIAAAISTKQPMVGLPEVSKLSVYPNPSNGTFNVLLSHFSGDKMSIEITDGNGKAVALKAFTLSSKTPVLTVPFDLGSKAVGMYWIKVVSATGVQTAKVLIQR